MRILVTIPDEWKEWLEDGSFGVRQPNLYDVVGAVMNGIVLPKGCGRLIDADKLKVELECGIRAGNYEEGYEKYSHINDMDDCVDAVIYADTVIEADDGEAKRGMKDWR